MSFLACILMCCIKVIYLKISCGLLFYFVITYIDVRVQFTLINLNFNRYIYEIKCYVDLCHINIQEPHEEKTMCNS